MVQAAVGNAGQEGEKGASVKMKKLGYIVVIKRSGGDGTPYPMVKTSCIIGRSSECDIRVQLPEVSQQQCQVEVDPSGKVTTGYDYGII